MRTAFVLGGASSVWSELKTATDIVSPDMIVATNDAGAVNYHVDHWVTLHAEKFRMWAEQRRSSGLPRAHNVWFHRDAQAREMDGTGYSASLVRSTSDWGGSSGLLAVKVALLEGATHVILCGVPMNAEGAHYFDSAAWRFAERYRTGWQRHLPDIAARVRSMGGWTRELLGGPDRVWLDNEKESTSGAQGTT